MMDIRPDWVEIAMDWIPYVGLVTRQGDGRGRPLLTRLVEGALPGILVAGITIYSQAQVHQNEIENLQRLQTNSQTEIDRLVAAEASMQSQIYDLNTRISILEGGQGSGGKVK